VRAQIELVSWLEISKRDDAMMAAENSVLFDGIDINQIAFQRSFSKFEDLISPK
jgi:hypothetical protein